MIELVVFDMAGTTVDEDNVVYKTVRAAINAAGHDFTQDQVQAAGAGKEKSQAIRDVLSSKGTLPKDAEVAVIFEDFKERLRVEYENLEVKEQPGASELFQELHARGIKVVLNTGYDRMTAESLVERIGWKLATDIDALVTASDVVDGRPAPDMIFKAMELTGVGAPEAVVKIGDSEIDVEEGKNAGCAITIGITTGAQSRGQLLKADPTLVIDRLAEVLPHIDATGAA
ncbi:MAG TPA: phosphonatase-like hydrolase [Planctomycetaceae bacterium]|nr:phosphonatase-like hydrolase [Planctomycetaceae bacterium]